MKIDGTAQFVPNELRVSVLRITGYEDKNITGYVENLYLSEKRPFTNLTQLLFILDELADNLNCPQRNSERRRLTDEIHKKPAGDTAAQPPSQKVIASFRIQIMFRQNASWQGNCEWIDNGKSANFRSALELIQMMDSVLA